MRSITSFLTVFFLGITHQWKEEGKRSRAGWCGASPRTYWWSWQCCYGHLLALVSQHAFGSDSRLQLVWPELQTSSVRLGYLLHESRSDPSQGRPSFWWHIMQTHTAACSTLYSPVGQAGVACLISFNSTTLQQPLHRSLALLPRWQPW